MLILLGKIFLTAALICGAAAPAKADSLTGACNKRLEADFIRGGGGNAWYVDCDAQGALELGGKIYQLFEYQTSGFGAVSLGMMEPGFAPDPANFDHVLDVDLQGAGDAPHAASLPDFSEFTITMTKGDGEDKKTLLSQKLSGQCDRSYNDKGERISKALESCEGAGWSLHITPAPQDGQ